MVTSQAMVRGLGRKKMNNIFIFRACSGLDFSSFKLDLVAAFELKPSLGFSNFPLKPVEPYVLVGLF